MKTGDIVKLKLTGERVMILPTGGMGFTTGPDIKIRKSNFELDWVYEIELEEWVEITTEDLVH